MYFLKNKLTITIFILPILFCIGSCSTSGGESMDTLVINDPVEHANGMFFPGNCEEPRNSIELLGHLDLPEPLTDIWGYYDAETDREYALAGFQSSEETNGGLYIADVTDPGNPVLVSILEEMEVHDVKVWKNFAYTVTGHPGDGEMGIVYDISDPANPIQAGSFESGHNLFISERGYLYKALPGVKAYDLIPDPTEPVLIWDDGETQDRGHEPAVIGNLLLDFHGFDGTFMYDNSNPHEPEFLHHFDNDSVRFHHSGWISRDGEYLYINDELPSNLNKNADISIWRIETGQMIGTFRDTTSTVHNNYQLCDRLIVSYYAKGLVLFDISEPSRLVLLDEFDTDTDVEGEGVFLGAWGVFPYTQSGNILVSDVNKGLYVFQLQ